MTFPAEASPSLTDQDPSFAPAPRLSFDNLTPENVTGHVEALAQVFAHPNTQTRELRALTDAMRTTRLALKEVLPAVPGLQERYASILRSPRFLRSVGNFLNQDELYTPEEWDQHYYDYGFLEDILHSLHVTDVRGTMQTWEEKQYPSDRHISVAIRKNLARIADIEEARPGAMTLLSGFYGIRRPDRYPAAMLIDQLDAHGDTSMPWGAYLTVALDTDGVYTNAFNARLPGKVYEQSKGRCHVRVVEATSGDEMKERQRNLDALYGESEQASFGVVMGHGEKFGIAFGAFAHLGHFSIMGGLPQQRRFFKPGAMLAFASCSTGQVGGIAQQISREQQITTVAPPEDVWVDNIRLTHNSHGVTLQPEYRGGDDFFDIQRADARRVRSNVFVNGRLLSDREYEDYFLARLQ